MNKRLWLVLRICIYALLAIGGIFVSAIRFHADLFSNASPNIAEDSALVAPKNSWELYYNKLLVIDDIDLSETECDTMIEMPHSWRGLTTKDGEILPLYGYASYRTTVDLFEGGTIVFKKEAMNVCVNVYLNRTLVASTGNVGKTLTETGLPFSYTVNEPFKVGDLKQAEVIIEVGYNLVGGINFTPKFVSNYYTSIEDEIDSHLAYVTIVVYFGLFLVEAFSVKRIGDSTIYTVNMTGTIFLTALFSPLTNLVLLRYGVFVPSFIFGILNFISYCLFLFCTLQFYTWTYLKKLSKKDICFGIALAGLALLAYAALTPFRLQFIAYIVYTLFYIGISIKATYFSKHKNSLDITAFFTKCIFYSVVGMEFAILCDTVDGFDVPVYSVVIIYLMIVFLVYIAVYVAFVVRTYRRAMKELKMEIQNKDLKLLVLKDQIKPHFVFNCLSSIKALYHEDEEKGDYAVMLLASHLRYNVDATSSNLIEFNKEIDNVYNYVELKNLRTKNKFNVFYNIDYQDFKIPILSIEPFVENAIKYSRINEKDDGFIEISSSCDDENIFIEIEDNGVGFNVSEVNENSQGIKNVKERYAILLNANVEIISEINAGTCVKITIPKERAKL